MKELIIANIIMGIGALINAIFMQLNDKRKIQIGLCIVNFISILSFLILKKYSAITVCVIAIIQTIIKSIYDKYNKKMPLYLQFTFIGISVFTCIFTVHTPFDILPTICLVFYTLSVLEPNESRFRIYTIFKLLGWIIYDFYAKAYTGFLFFLCVFVSTIIAIFRYDIFKKAKPLNQ